MERSIEVSAFVIKTGSATRLIKTPAPEPSIRTREIRLGHNVILKGPIGPV